MEGQITEAVKKVRSEEMIKMHHRHAKEYEEAMLGCEMSVLLEEECTIGGEVYYVGHSREYVKTAVKKQDDIKVNDIVSVTAESFLEEHILLGVMK